MADRRFPMLVAAPEGTCGDGRSILHFRSGCFLPGAPVLPVLIQYEKRTHNPAWTIINEGWHFVRPFHNRRCNSQDAMFHRERRHCLT